MQARPPDQPLGAAGGTVHLLARHDHLARVQSRERKKIGDGVLLRRACPERKAPGGRVVAEMVDQRSRRLWLAERERVGLGAGLEERDLQCPLADRVVLAQELVQPALPEQPFPVLVDVHAA